VGLNSRLTFERYCAAVLGQNRNISELLLQWLHDILSTDNTMCGITAILALKDSAGSSYDCHANHDILAKDIDNSLEIVKHRGPDARGQWISAARDVGKLSLVSYSLELVDFCGKALAMLDFP